MGEFVDDDHMQPVVIVGERLPIDRGPGVHHDLEPGRHPREAVGDVDVVGEDQLDRDLGRGDERRLQAGPGLLGQQGGAASQRLETLGERQAEVRGGQGEP